VAAVLGITTVKSFTYRDVAGEQWSNSYHFDAIPPSNPTTWKIVVDALATHEATALPTGTKIVQAYGYDTDDPLASSVFGWNYTAAGDEKLGAAGPPGDAQKIAGDQALMFWAKTDQLNTKGRNIFLRKYWHGGYALAADQDKISATYKSTLQTFVDALVAGTIVELGHWRAQREPSTILAHGVDPWVTTRSLKRRGKKKKPAG
jgi:hypothetical protein